MNPSWGINTIWNAAKHFLDEITVTEIVFL